MRFPNLFTAMADVLAGYFIVFGSHIDWSDLLGLLLSTSAIYAGGCVLNDIQDKAVDLKERPFRPLPSGKISVHQASILLLMLFGLGLFGAFQAGWTSSVIACSLIISVISYDAITKQMPYWGPINMGACRFWNLLLGMSLAPPVGRVILIFPCISLVYVFSLTTLSRFEVDANLRRESGIVLSGWLCVVLGIIGLMLGEYILKDSYIFLCLFVLFTGPPLFVALFRPEPNTIMGAVKAMVLGIPLLGAVYSAGIQGWMYGIPVALCVFPSVFFARRLYVT
jgi:4-hydroxybenzoate polyprenyltransferase